ncbi:MAG: VRR-NUC domain-containing protein [Bryobacterales bacterium]|nr:VRR-NUC domain-containing protein [Bryobacterales bacterium]
MSGASVAREASIVAAILRALSRVEGLVVRKRWGGAMGSAGDPDLSGCYRGRHFEFEVKAPGGRLTKLQVARLEEWRDAGAIVGVARSPKDVLTALGITPQLRHSFPCERIDSGWETAESLTAKLPAKGARKPNADEQAGDWGDT